MGVTILILVMLLMLYRIRKSRLRASKGMPTDPLLAYTREANAGLVPYPAGPPPGAIFIPAAFDGRTKNAEISSQQAQVHFNAMPYTSYVDPSTVTSVSQPSVSSDATAREEIRVLRERVATLESQVRVPPAEEGVRTERRVRSIATTISETVPGYSEE
jgi:hypothetical protein